MFKELMTVIAICGACFFVCSKIYEKVKKRNTGKQHAHIINLSHDACKNMEEKRLFPRIKVGLPVLLFSRNLTGAFPATTGDISLCGAFLKCDALLGIGEIINLEFPNEKRLPVMTAQVVWSNSGVPQERVLNRGLGVRFTDVTQSTRKTLEQILSER